jgi:hypothetical protein
MSLNDIQLTPSLLAELYGSTLIFDEKSSPDPTVEIQEMHVQEVKTGEVKKSLGGNKKNITIVVQYPGYPVIPDHDLGFLSGILLACKLGLDDVIVANLTQFENGYQDIKNEFRPRIICMFGVTPADLDLPMVFPEFQVQSYAGQTLLSSPSLPALENDKVLKSKLWVSLRRLFNI